MAEYYLVERDLPEPMTAERLRGLEPRLRFCLDAHRVQVLRSYLSPDGLRMICLFEAPDAEAVVSVNAQSGFPFERIHRVSLHEADGA